MVYLMGNETAHLLASGPPLPLTFDPETQSFTWVYDPTTDYKVVVYYVTIILGCILVASLVVDFILALTPRQLFTTSTLGRWLLSPAGLKGEVNSKKAAFWKSSMLLNNALDIQNSHDFSKGRSSVRSSIRSEAITAYHMREGDTRQVGGVLWTWKKMVDGTLFQEEGIWIHGRLLAINAAQLFVVRTSIFVIK